MNHRRIAVFAVHVALLAMMTAHAQMGTATITGRVADSTGAVIQAAEVTVVNADTNFQYKGTTNNEGIYRIQSLQPGRYRVGFQAAGFKRLTKDEVAIRGGDVVSVDGALEVGQITESIDVKASVPLLETETSVSGTVAEGKFLYELPIFQRFTNYVLNVTPQVQGGATWAEVLSGFHVAGARNVPGMFEDGVQAQDSSSGSNDIKVVQNSIAEVKVMSTALPAEYGHSAGGAISIVTKTGTNTFHGLGSIYGRSRMMEHRDFFDRYKTSQSSPTAPNGTQGMSIIPDFNLSGPVFIPKIYNGKNKTFFLVGYQRFIEKITINNLLSVPTPEMMAGDMSMGGLGNVLYDPASTRQLADGSWVRDPFPTKTIPQARIDPVARKVLSINPWTSANLAPNYTANGPNNNLLAVTYSLSVKPDSIVRIDHQFTNNVKMFGSATWNENFGIGKFPYQFRLKDFDSSTGGTTPTRQLNVSVGNTWVIGPTMFNDMRAGYYRRHNWRTHPAFGQDWGSILGIPGLPAGWMPSLNTGYGFSGASNNNGVDETLSFRDDLTKMHGAHAFKMGYEILRVRQDTWTRSDTAGTFSFDGAAGLQSNGVAIPRTGNTFAGFLLGYVSQGQFTNQIASYLPRDTIHSFYFQDDWKVSPSFTLNLGLRYTNESPFRTKYAQMSQFDATVTDPVTGLKGAITHPTAPLNRRDNNNFQPRLGLAWHPLSKLVFRSGFAVNTLDVKFPGGQFDDYTAVVNQQAAPGDPRPLYSISQGPNNVNFAASMMSNGTAIYQGTNYGSRTATQWDPALRNPYVLNWNAMIQYSLSTNYLVELGYVGSAGLGLLETLQINSFPTSMAAGNPALQQQILAKAQNYRPFPQFGSVNVTSNYGHSTHHEGTVKLEKRYSRGLNFLTFYTFGKTIDSGTSVAAIENRSLGKGRADYDINHRLVGSATYELPMGQGRRFLNKGGWWNRIFGGYSAVWIQTIQSGQPMTFTYANSPSQYYPTYIAPSRPNAVSPCSMRDGYGSLGGDRFNVNNQPAAIDINCFAYPAAFTPGNAGRNTMTGPGIIWSQASAQKNIQINERVRAQLRWDMNNVLHHFNKSAPSTAVDFQNPQAFGKFNAATALSSFGGKPVMHLTLAILW